LALPLSSLQTNKRFLKNILKSTDDHNRALLLQLKEQSIEKIRELRHRTDSNEEQLKEYKSPTSHFNPTSSKLFRKAFESKSTSKRKRDFIESNNSSKQEFQLTSEKKKHLIREENLIRPIASSDTDHDDEDNNGDRHDIHAETLPVNKEKRGNQINKSPTEPSPKRTVRGRGTIGSSQLDKVFQTDYNPKLDMDNYDDTNMHHYIEALDDLQYQKEQEIKEKKHKHKSKYEKKKSTHKKRKKKEKHSKKTSSKRSSDSDSDTRVDYILQKTELEKPKAQSPQYALNTHLPSACPW